MPVVDIQDVGQHEGQEITLRGWLYNLRESGENYFSRSFGTAREQFRASYR